MKTLFQVFIIIFLISYNLKISTIKAASLKIPESFDVLRIDGKKYDKSFFSLDKQLELSLGEHTLELQYNEYFEDPDDDGHVFINSDPFLITFTISDNQNLLLSRPPFDDESSAIRYAEQPTVFIKNIANITTKLVKSKVPTDKRLAHMKLEINADSSTAVRPTKEMNKPDVSHENLTKLKNLWQQASAEEKERFKQYIKE